MHLEFFIVIITGIFLVGLFIYFMVDSASVMFFNRPVYVHWYWKTKKLTPQQGFYLRQHFPILQKRPRKDQKHFEHRVARFIQHYAFIGRENLVVTEEMKVMIAGTAVLLSFGMRHYLIATFDKIILFLTAYYSNSGNNWHKGEFNPRMKAIVFSWKDFVHGFSTKNDNLHLGFHEFAHAYHFHGLKSQDSSAIIFADMYQKIKKYVLQTKHHQKLITSNYFRIYAYTNSFEFVAVLLEHFFETPEKFQEEFPELFQKVKKMINYRW